LADKNEIIALSKTDTISEDERDKKIKTLEDMTGKEIYALSSVTNKGLE
jgi:GTPase involved in cell partitioning and DNA repair